MLKLICTWEKRRQGRGRGRRNSPSPARAGAGSAVLCWDEMRMCFAIPTSSCFRKPRPGSLAFRKVGEKKGGDLFLDGKNGR